jgi:GT2 family glycosyltransferase
VQECLDSLNTYARNPRAEIIVVGNGSSDGTPELVLESYPGVTLIENQEKFGFAKANNVGVRRSTGEYVRLTNSDGRVFEG